MQSLVAILHMDEESANAARGQSAVCRDTLEGEGCRLHEPELLVKIEDVLLQTLEIVAFFLVRRDGVPGAEVLCYENENGRRNTHGSVGVNPISSAIARCLALRWLSVLLTAPLSGAVEGSASGDCCLFV